MCKNERFKMNKILIGSTLGLVSVQAFAALPASVTTAISDAQADGQTLGYAYLVMAVVVGVIFWLKRKA